MLLDIHKAHDMMDQGRTLAILKGYGVTKMGITRSPLPQNNGNLPLPLFLW